jgi:hypothetical protein
MGAGDHCRVTPALFAMRNPPRNVLTKLQKVARGGYEVPPRASVITIGTLRFLDSNQDIASAFDTSPCQRHAQHLYLAMPAQFSHFETVPFLRESVPSPRL